MRDDDARAYDEEEATWTRGRGDEPGDLGEWDAGADNAAIPPRQWLLGTTFCRRFVSSLLARGGGGKSSLRIAQLLACATGRPLTGERVFQRCRVLIVSLEDDADELRRRLLAPMIHHRVTHDEIEGRLYLAAPGIKGWKLAMTTPDGTSRGELVDRIAATIKKHSIDIVCIDPFVKSHAVEENANGEIDFVANILATLAIEHDCAVDAPHHVKKGPSEAGDADAGRGASAFKAARLVYTLTPMSDDDRRKFGISEDERRRVVRMDSGKVNIARMDAARWFRFVGVRLGNSTDEYPNGDEVQTVEPWTPPDAWEHVNSVTANAVLMEIDAGLSDGRRFSNSGRATTRAAWPIVQKHARGLTKEQARRVVDIWIKNGVLVEQPHRNPKSRKGGFGLCLDPTRRPT